MATDEPTRKMTREFKRAGWTELRHDGRHTVYGCPCGQHTFPLPTTHRNVSAGVVAKARKAIAQG